MWEGRTETDCTTKGISVQKIMPAPFLHMLVCLLACLLWVIMIFYFSLSDMKAEAKAKAKRDTLFFSFFLIWWCDAYRYLSYF